MESKIFSNFYYPKNPQKIVASQSMYLIKKMQDYDNLKKRIGKVYTNKVVKIDSLLQPDSRSIQQRKSNCVQTLGKKVCLNKKVPIAMQDSETNTDIFQYYTYSPMDINSSNSVISDSVNLRVL